MTSFFPSSGNPSPMTKRSRLALPGTLTRTEVLAHHNRPIRWFSQLTPITYPSFSQPSSSFQSASRSRKRHRLTTTPNAPTAIDLDVPLPDAPRNTPSAPTLGFMILVWLTDARTPPAPKAATPKTSVTAVVLPPPHCPNCGDDHYAFYKA